VTRYSDVNPPGFEGPEAWTDCRKTLGAGGMDNGEVSLIGEPKEGFGLPMKSI
jgi:hypothetical protein